MNLIKDYIEKNREIKPFEFFHLEGLKFGRSQNNGKYIKESIAKKLSNYGVPNKCPKCNRLWKPEAPTPRIVREGFLTVTNLSAEYYKMCEFCGHIHTYYS
jgi:hypothetical protein